MDARTSYASYEAAISDIVSWANTAFPERDFGTVQRKLAMCELPELTIAIGKGSVEGITEEVADVLILIFDMCNLLRIDPLQAIKQKMNINKDRKWEIDEFGVSQHV